MKKRRKSIMAFILACGMAFSLISGGEGAVADAAGKSNRAGNEPTDEKKDLETGYTYTLYEEEGEGEAAIQRAKIIGYAGSGTELAIPARIGQYQVGSIGDGAFKGNAAITSVTIPSGITCIGYEAFQGCESLARVALPPTITDWSDHIGNGYQSSAFAGCTALTKITLPEGLAVLGQNAFQGCVKLESVTIPSTILAFRDTVFAGCTSLVNLELKEGVRQIGYRAFQGCAALEEVVIPSTIESWGTVHASGIMAAVHDCAPFFDCAALKKVTFREGLKTLRGFQGVRGCPLVKELDIPPSVEDISYAFTDCDQLEKVTLHEGIESIGSEAFKNCAALREAIIPDSVTAIQYSAYRGCAALERLVLPPQAVMLEGSITSGCTSLRELYILAEEVKWYQALDLPSEGKLYCIEGSGTYSTYQAKVPEKVTAIPGAGGEAAGGEYIYDGSLHPAATLKGIREGDEIRYRLDDGDYRKDMPQISEPGTYAVEITVRRQMTGEPMQYAILRAQTVIRKRQQTLHLPDIEAEEGEGYAVAGEGYLGQGEPLYSYYLDAACTRPASGKPEAAGEYYVRASIPETDYDLAVQSNTAKIIIHKKDMPGTDPSASQKPGENTGTEPSASQNPGENPGVTTSASPGPGTNATASPEPGVNPGQTSGPSGITVPKVGRVTLKKAKSVRKKTLLIQWKKVSKASGYQVQVGLNRKFTKGKKSDFVHKGKTAKKTVRKLKRKKIYYVRVRAYRAYQGGRKYGKWSKIKKARVR